MSEDRTMPEEDRHMAARQLRVILSSERNVFAIGGIISSSEPSSLSVPEGCFPFPTTASYPVVRISWKKLGNDQICHTVSLPFFGEDGPEEFDDLLRDHREGSLGGFLVNFNPYDYRIVDAVSRLLCPGYGFSKHQELKAQLRSLDISSSYRTQTLRCDPEPRVDADFGRLLVCLPCKHKGGSLKLLCQDDEDDTETLQLDWAKESGSGKIQGAAFLNPTAVSQSRVTSGYSIVLTYTLRRTSYGIGEVPMPLPILDVTTHSWYRKVKDALSSMQGLDQVGVTIGYSCTGDYSFPLINSLPLAGCGLQGFLTGADLLVYHILGKLADDVRTRLVLDKPSSIPRHHEHASLVLPLPSVTRVSQNDTRDMGSDDKDKEAHAAAEITRSGLLDNVWWLNYSPWSPSSSWRGLLLPGGPGQGRKGLECRLCVPVIVATLVPRAKKRHSGFISSSSTTATTAIARAISPPRRKKRRHKEGSQPSPLSPSQPSATQ